MDSEKYVVAGLIDSKAVYTQIAKSGLTVQDFADEKLAKIFSERMRGYVTDQALSFWELCEIDKDNLDLYLDLESYSKSTQSLDFHIGVIKRLAVKRRLLAKLTDWRAKLASEDGTQPIAFDKIANDISESVSSASIYAAPESFVSLYQKYLTNAESGSPVTDFINVGYPTLNRALGGLGLKREDVWGIAAKTGEGKSMICLNIATRSALAGHKVLYVTIEMDADSLMQRAVADLAQIEGTRMRNGIIPPGHEMEGRGLGKRDMDKLVGLLQQNQKMEALENLYILDSTSSIRDVERTIRLEGFVKPFDLVVIDYLQLFNPGDGHHYRSSFERVGAVSTFIKSDIAKKHRVAVITCLQVNREGSKVAPHEMSAFHIRDSNQVNQDCDYLSVLYHPELTEHDLKYQYNNATKISHMRFDKQRHGESNCLIVFNCIGKYLRFEEI
jgi:replicative DNA helicase